MKLAIFLSSSMREICGKRTKIFFTFSGGKQYLKLSTINGQYYYVLPTKEKNYIILSLSLALCDGNVDIFQQNAFPTFKLYVLHCIMKSFVCILQERCHWSNILLRFRLDFKQLI